VQLDHLVPLVLLDPKGLLEALEQQVQLAYKDRRVHPVYLDQQEVQDYRDLLVRFINSLALGQNILYVYCALRQWKKQIQTLLFINY
jgi:hypothetical protein